MSQPRICQLRTCSMKRPPCLPETLVISDSWPEPPSHAQLPSGCWKWTESLQL